MSAVSKLLSPDDLRTVKGIRFSRMHLHRLVKAGKFPAPVKIGANTNSFLEDEVDRWIIARAKERGAAPATS
jgi:prophage regulatory protein